MVAVGDEDGPGAHRADHGRDRRHVGHRPDAVDDAQVVGRFERRDAGDRRFQQVLGFVLRIGIQAEDLAEVRLARGPQLQPVGLRGAVRLFVRVDLALAEPREPHAAHEAAAGVRRRRRR